MSNPLKSGAFTIAGAYSFVILPTISPFAFNPVTFIVLFPSFKLLNSIFCEFIFAIAVVSVISFTIFPFSATVYFTIGFVFVIVVFNVIFFIFTTPCTTDIS